jgi:hypothetical protein
VSIKIEHGAYMLSTVAGLGLARTWFPRIVDEAFLESQKDGEIKISPDPVTMIEGAVAWTNASDDGQHVEVIVHCAPRLIVAQSPADVVIHDAWSWRVGKSPEADFPSVSQNTFGGKMQIDRVSVAPDKLDYGRFFLYGDDYQTRQNIGTIPPGQGFHFRYMASVQTPGVWTEPTEFEARWEAHAFWTRLLAKASPVGDVP